MKKSRLKKKKHVEEKPRKKMLLVEDESEIRGLTKKAFLKLGFDVIEADCGEDALLLIQTQKPEIIILDLTIKGQSGLSVLEELRKKDKQTKVIVLTGLMNNVREEREAKKLGVSGYYVKPQTHSAVVDAVKHAYGEKIHFEQTKRKKLTEKEIASTYHDFSNIVLLIYARVARYSQDLKDGVYKKKTEKQKFAAAHDIIKLINEDVKKNMDKLEKVRQGR